MRVIMFGRQSIFIHGTIGSLQKCIPEINITGTSQTEELWEQLSASPSAIVMGVTWDENNFRSAINRNDTRITQLFLQGGMDWKLSWTEEAMSAEHDDVLELMLHYRQNMVEEKPCRRFINTLGHAMSDGESLTAIRKEYLKAFCTVPAVVKRQQHDTGSSPACG